MRGALKEAFVAGYIKRASFRSDYIERDAKIAFQVWFQQREREARMRKRRAVRAAR